MITIFVWLPKQKSVGHASMLVNGQTYISWWPDEAAGLGRDFHPLRNKSYSSDVGDEGGVPDSTIELRGLDEEKILNWWQGFGLTRENTVFQGPLPPYNLATQNCSTVVATALKKGGGDRYASWYRSWSIVWRPQTVLDYARSIQRSLVAATK